MGERVWGVDGQVVEGDKALGKRGGAGLSMSAPLGGREVRVLGAWKFSVHFSCLSVKQEGCQR